MQYYSSVELRKKKDINGKKPKILLSFGGRTTGKTTEWNNVVFNEFLKNGCQFVLLYRFKYEIDNIANRFFKSIDFLNPGHKMTDKNTNNLGFSYLFIDDKLCGFAVAINSANAIKKFSALFADVKYILFDEVIPEDGHYCDREIKKFTSIYTSIARGHGKPIRDDVQIIMIANEDTTDHLYASYLNLKRTGSKTHYQRGDGWVCEWVENREIQSIQKQDPILRIFDNGFITGENTNDNYTNVEKMVNGSPICNIEIKNEIVGFWKNDNNYFITKKQTNKKTYSYERFENSKYPFNEGVKKIILKSLEKSTLKFENIHIKNLFLR